MNILITGCPGYLGNVLKSYFQIAGNRVYTMGLERQPGNPNHISGDLSAGIPKLPVLELDLVIHAAGKAHCSERDEAERALMWKVNLDGTQHLVQALEQLAHLPKAFLFISTLDVYGLESGSDITEEQPLNPVTAYAASKAAAEEFLLRTLQGRCICGIVRLPLIVGPNPPGTLGRMIKAMQKGIFFTIAGGKARKSMISICDIGPFLERLSQHGGVYNLTDGQHPSFRELNEVLAGKLGVRRAFTIPGWLGRLMGLAGSWGEKLTGHSLPFNLQLYEKMTNTITYSDALVKREMRWVPTPVIQFIERDWSEK